MRKSSSRCSPTFFLGIPQRFDRGAETNRHHSHIFAFVTDPVGSGLVASFLHSGGELPPTRRVHFDSMLNPVACWSTETEPIDNLISARSTIRRCILKGEREAARPSRPLSSC